MPSRILLLCSLTLEYTVCRHGYRELGRARRRGEGKHDDVTDRQPALQNDRREEKEEYAISCSS